MTIAKHRKTARWLAITLSVIVLQGCAGTKEVGLVADGLEGSTPLMAQRVATLKKQHVDLAASYNQLRSHTVATYQALQEQHCRALAQQSRASLYEAEADAHVFLQTEFDKATDLIAPAITDGLAALQAEIDRQHNLKAQQQRSGSAMPLPGQYADIVLVALLQERDSIRLRLVIAAVSGLQSALSDARGELGTYVQEQLQRIAAVESQCIEGGAIGAAITTAIGDETVPPEGQYELTEAYLAQVAMAAQSLKLYSETNNLFGNRGLLRVFTGGVVSGLSGVDQAPAASDDGSPPQASTLRDALESVSGSLPAPLRGLFEMFSRTGLLQATGLDQIAQVFGNVVENQETTAEESVEPIVEKAKSDADEEITSGDGR